MGDKPKHVNWIADGYKYECIEGKVNGTPAKLVADTGAEITVVPGNFVYEGQMLANTVEIIGAT